MIGQDFLLDFFYYKVICGSGQTEVQQNTKQNVPVFQEKPRDGMNEKTNDFYGELIYIMSCIRKPLVFSYRGRPCVKSIFYKYIYRHNLTA